MFLHWTLFNLVWSIQHTVESVEFYSFRKWQSWTELGFDISGSNLHLFSVVMNLAFILDFFSKEFSKRFAVTMQSALLYLPDASIYLVLFK